MTGALVLITSGLLVLTLGHLPLRLLSRPRCEPRAAIAAWLLGITGALASVSIGVVVLVLPNHAGLLGLLGNSGGSLAHLTHEGTPSLEEAAGLLGTILVAAAVGRAAILALRLSKNRRRSREHHRFLARVLGSSNTTGDVVWLESNHLIAYSLSGRPGMVVISCGVRDALEPAAIDAAIEHERAHLRGMHHLLLAIAENLAAALPFIPLLRRAAKELPMLVEYAADSAAVERCGTPAVRSALLAFIGVPRSSPGLAINGRAVVNRLDRLSIGPRRSPRRRKTYTLAAGAAAAILPVAASTAVFVGILCPIS